MENSLKNSAILRYLCNIAKLVFSIYLLVHKIFFLKWRFHKRFGLYLTVITLSAF